MYTTYLRKVGGSVMLALPPAILDMLDLSAGSTVGLTVAQGKITIETSRYSLEELLAQCDPQVPMTEEDQAWLSDGPAGGELL